MNSNNFSDARRPDKEHRHKPKIFNNDCQALTPREDLTHYMNTLVMILGMCGLFM